MISPNEGEMRWTTYQLERLYASAKWNLPLDFLEESHFLRVVYRKVKMQSSPGFPLMCQFPTNADVFGFDGLLCDPARLRMVYSMVKDRINDYEAGVKAADVIRLFIKPEPHKKDKIRQRRWRLISSVSLVDQLVDQMLFADGNDAELDNHTSLPVKIGWAPQHGGFTQLQGQLGRGPYLNVDKSSWDWGMDIWVVDVFRDLRNRLCLNRDEERFKRWENLVAVRLTSLYRDAKFMLSDGRVYEQQIPGLQKSGSVLTLSLNSMAQIALHLLASRRANVDWRNLPVSIGDDTTQRVPERLSDYLKQLSKLGCQIKGNPQPSDEIEFAGHIICGNSCVPMYTAKHYFSLLYAEEEVLAETLESYMRLYALDSERCSIIRRWLGKVNPQRVMSERGLVSWYRGLEAFVPSG